KERPQPVTRARRLFVVGSDLFVSFSAAELPGKLSPKRAHDSAIGFRGRVARGNLVSHEDDAANFGQQVHLCVLHDAVDARQFTRRRVGKEVIQREHRVSFSSAEVCLQLYYRVPTLAGQTPDGTYQ